MTEPASHAGFRDLARKALSPRTGIPAKTDWEVFLHGFASTNQRGGEKEREIYECLLRTFPTPESVLEQDLRTLRNKEGCQNLQSPVPAADWMKKSAANWDNIAPLLRCRTRAQQDAIRNFTDDPQNQNKRLVKQFTGAGYKGADMTLLWGGCEVPVVDKQLIRYLAPHMLGKDWDSYIREQLSLRKDRGGRLRIGQRFAAELGEDIEAVDIDVDNSNHRSAEEEDIVSKIQSTVGRYGAWRDLAYQMADAERIPANIWHVATWLEYRIGGDPDSPRANPRTLARGREFAERTYAPSETPEAVTDDMLYHLNRDIETLTSYGLRQENVERGRGPAYTLHWSNAQARWLVFYSRLKVGTAVRLDANEFIGYGKKSDLEEAAPQLDPLPLFYGGPRGGSFEYKERRHREGGDPGAWYNHHPHERQLLIDAGGGYNIIHPVSGETISLSLAQDRLNYLPDPRNDAIPGDGEWWLLAGPQSADASSLDNITEDILDAITQSQLWLLTQGRTLGPALDEEVRKRYAALITKLQQAWQFADEKGLMSETQAIRDLLPNSINSDTQLRQLYDKLERYKMSLRDADKPMLEAIMQAEEEAIIRGMASQTPSAELGVFNTPEYYDPDIQEYRFYEYGPLDEDDSPYIDAYEHTGTDVSGEGELLDDEVYQYEDMGKKEFLSGETPQSHVVWDIDDVKVEIDYGPWTSRLGERIDHAAWVSIERYGGRPFDSYMFTPGGPIAQVTDLLDQVHAKNPGIRIVATATQDPEGRGDLRARAYERYGWKRISGTDASGGVDMELPPPDQRTPRTPRTPNSFDGIDRYADAIMELV